MTVIRALELARQNGYVGPDDPLCFLEPTFFQSLGKAMGWKAKGRRNLEGLKLINKGSWLYFWHRLIDHLAEGKTAEDYFKSLN